MWKLSRLAAAAALVVLAGWGFVRLIIEPYRCGILQRQLKYVTESLIKSDRVNAAIGARGVIERLSICERCCRTTPDPYMIRAANYRIMGQYPEAMNQYRKALSFGQRPEILLNLAETQIDSGQDAAANETLRRVLQFNPKILGTALRLDVRARLTALQEESRREGP